MKANKRSRIEQWWRPPQSVRDREADRRISFLELFYDLVYVVLIAQFAHALTAHLDTKSITEFLFLFLIVWVAWINGSMYHELHGNDDVRTRVTTFLQMFCVIAMASFAHDPLGETSLGFAVSFGTFQLLLTYLWWTTGVHDPDHRPFSVPYSFVFLITVGLFYGSAFVDARTRAYMWAVAVGLTVALPLVLPIVTIGRPELRAQTASATRIGPSTTERFGLFTIIVLGEVVVGIVRGVSLHHDVTAAIGSLAALGVLIAVGLWWSYFDFIAHHQPKERMSAQFSWIYLHLPLTAAIVLAGVAVSHVIEYPEPPIDDSVRLIVGVVTAVFQIVLVLLTRVVAVAPEHEAIHKTARWWLIGTAVLALAGGIVPAAPVGPALVLGAAVFLLFVPITVGIIVWIRSLPAVGSMIG